MKIIKLNWSDFKTNLSNKKALIQHYISSNHYKIFFMDGQIEYQTEIEIESTPINDQLEFETSYIPVSNNPLSDLDNAGRPVTRIAASNKGTSYKAHFFDFTTSKLDSLVCKSWDGMTDMGFSTKYYKMDGTELTTQTDIDSMCVKTVVIFSPMYDYELISGTVNLQTSPSENLRLWVTGGVSELGGVYVKEFIRNLNLKFISPSETLQTDGRASKFMKANTMGVPYNTNQLQIVVLSDTPGIKHDIMMNFEYFIS